MKIPEVKLKKRHGLYVLILLFLIPPLVIALAQRWQVSDDDPDRGATTVKNDVFGDSASKIVYLEQNWKPAQSLWFYTTTQGSNLLPYDFFLVLEQAGKPELFRSDENINRYRYLPQKKTSSNPDALPVGFVKDNYLKKDYMGFTCAACHTAQINYKGTGMRIDGGPATADMSGFLQGLTEAMVAVRDKPEVQKRFVRAVMQLGSYSSEAEVIADIKTYTLRLTSYNIINHSPVDYGYARLDAFGRIYNRTLEHLLNRKQIEEVLGNLLSEAEVKTALEGFGENISSSDRDKIIERVATSPKQIVKLRQELFIKADAPVSYPFLWDIAQHDYVQWNGLGGNGGLGPLGRNTGEVIGVFGSLDWHEGSRFSLASLIAGQGLKKKTVEYDSSINTQNLRRIESQLVDLQSPKWPQDILGKLDQTRIKRGARLFDKYCVSCHAEIDRSSPERRVVAHMSKLEEVGTDPTMANNSVNYTGYSGILRNQYVGAGVGDVLLDKKAPVAALLTKATLGVVTTPDADKGFIRRWSEWLYNIITAFFSNEIKDSNKHGNYIPDTTMNPYSSLQAYKGRSLNGIWATGPYLHNGSVPTLYDLLLPACSSEQKDGECRPEKFQVGSREFDAEKVGLKSTGYQGFTFDTRLPGNLNTGHDYGTKAPKNPGDLPMLSKEERLDLLEYLKDQ
ncbi:di-heme-cytochrome C peroxidase [Undibacterium sp. TS12]|uniref:di-heme-cytochrome C peroxidase n=1 Tax=Undibacterium sp. TS12 TaxID=2908202 RepID=UPI001F4D33D1|nr:di-heme-cytochrome C peroxidase [Undibacterium sp. TS12]MCH8621017.1 di-heme-cytochrome C peroxidase [Undibacterium sp. TS12]